MGGDQVNDPLDATAGLLLGSTRGASSFDARAPIPLLPLGTDIPARIGDYQILGVLGRGGMGEVLLGLDESLSRKVAIKRIRRELVEEETIRKRFDVEARVTSILQHPSIVPVYHYARGSDGGFYTMRPIEGITLREIVVRIRRDEPEIRDAWPVPRLLRLFLQAANAVDYAHSCGVIHRDLKPANIMIGPFEEVLILDWGTAKVLGEVDDAAQQGLPAPLKQLSTDTTDGTIVGSPAYMAPEQLRGEAATSASDLFSLAVALYEILATRHPWNGDDARSIDELLDRMRTPPPPPTSLEPSRGIPHELALAVVKALDYDPARRFQSVAQLSREIANALEGRATWHQETESGNLGNWQMTNGRAVESDGGVILHSRGAQNAFLYACDARCPSNVRIELELSTGGGSHELSVILTPDPFRQAWRRSGYELELLRKKSRTLSLLRAGRIVAGGKCPAYEPRKWHSVRVTCEDDRFSLTVDGEEIFAHHEPIPLPFTFVALAGSSDGIHVRGLRVLTRGSDAMVSCLAVPDAFFNRRLFDEARAEYERIRVSHRGRPEGQLAGFRAGLSLLELAETETDGEVRELFYVDAESAFSRLESSDDCSLAALGRGMVAERRGRFADQRGALLKAYREHPDDPHLRLVTEWILSRLHAAGRDNRRLVAELLPIAIRHCLGGLGSRVVQDVLQEVRKREWEIPSFLIARGGFREEDPVSRAETCLFYAFWAGCVEEIIEVGELLLASDRFRKHHVHDVAFALLELGEPERALAFLSEAMARSSSPTGDVYRLPMAAAAASAGDHERGLALFTGVEPLFNDRSFNSARLALGRALLDAGKSVQAIRVLKPLAPQDRFAREHLAWVCLSMEDGRQADKQLKALLERGDHKTGRNLSNFLHGVSLTLRGRKDEARRVFELLTPYPWPRTWTLGSHYSAGRLGKGDLDAYLRNAFRWEVLHLQRQASLLASVERRDPPDLLETGAVRS